MNFNTLKYALYKATKAAPKDPIYFYALLGFTGNLGGRSGADMKCTAGKPTTPTPCTNIHAVLSVNEDDEIRDMPMNYALPINAPIKGAGTNNTGKNVASNFTKLQENGLSRTLVNGGYLTEIGVEPMGAFYAYAASNFNNAVNTTQTCMEWTVTTGKTSGFDLGTSGVFGEPNQNCDGTTAGGVGQLLLKCACW